MSSIKRTIHADKAGIIAQLLDDRDYRMARAQYSATQKEARYQQGVAEGLWLASRVIEDWAEADAITMEEPNE